MPSEGHDMSVIHMYTIKLYMYICICIHVYIHINMLYIYVHIAIYTYIYIYVCSRCPPKISAPPPPRLLLCNFFKYCFFSGQGLLRVPRRGLAAGAAQREPPARSQLLGSLRMAPYCTHTPCVNRIILQIWLNIVQNHRRGSKVSALRF